MHNPANPISALTWKEILAEEPFSGQHWEGAYGLPPGSTVEQWETRSGGSTPSLSPLDDSDSDEEERDEEDFFPEANHAHLPSTVAPSIPVGNRHHPDSLESYNFDYRTQVEDLQARQYWRAEWRTDASLARHFNLGDASTLGEVGIFSG
jgi:gamma-tubulin complex component 5